MASNGLRRWLAVAAAVSMMCAVGNLCGQVAGTGAISGTVRDPSGAVVPGAAITATDLATGLARNVVSSASGKYTIQLLEPGRYRLSVTKSGFATAVVPNVVVNVTQITTVNPTLTVGSRQETVTVQANPVQLQTESSTLGSVVSGEMVQSLPLVTRNYTQIVDMSPGVAADVTNAGAFGRGNSAPVTAGTTDSENNFQMNGVEINDLQASGSFSGGIAVPNPDTIAEFKVQTSQYDASYGRNAGSNVNVVTKTGSNQMHGSLWGYFRNEAFNANDYFRKQLGQRRPELRQTQPGLALGGPIRHDKLFYFVSYQSTRQINGLDANCSTVLYEPPLTNDRSAAALGAMFSSQPTLIEELVGGPYGANVAPDGSNIAPQALALFNLKLPNGQYLIPTPQAVNTALPFSAQGVSAISDPCHFNEDQFMTNGDWDQSPASQWQVRFFFANSEQAFTLPGANLGGATVPGFPQSGPEHYRNFSITNNHIFSSNLLNQAEFGYHRTWADTKQNESFQYSTIGAAVPSFDTLPEINFLGGITLGGNGQTVLIAQNTFVGEDTVSWTRGSHAFRFGGGVTYAQDNISSFEYLTGLIFGTYPDALLGESAAQNGTPLSNMYASIDLPFQPQRGYRAPNYHAYVQDDYKATSRLTLNLGFRFEHVGDLVDSDGRNANFDMLRDNANPPASGTLQGFVVGANYKGTVPAGVIKNSSNLAFAGDGQNTLNPRVGFAWQLPGTDRLVLRGGYGMYHETPTGQPNIQLLINPPFADLREYIGFGNGAADWANPLPPFTGTFPMWVPYSPSSALSLFTYANNFRPAVIQHFSLDVQAEVAQNTLLEIGYLGTRGQHLDITRLPDQALSASASHPVRGQTDNTDANIPLRMPVEGFSIPSFNQVESSGSSWYHALLANFTKRFHNGSEAQIAYTWSSNLADTVEPSIGADGGDRLGNQTDPRADYGQDYYTRPQRLIANFVFQIPTPFRSSSLAGETLGGWSASGIVTIQSGHWLFFTNTNTFNAFGISGAEQDFAELSPSCTRGDISKHGSVTGRLNDYFNAGCFYSSPGVTVPYPVVGGEEPPGTCAVPLPDGNCPAVATGFGNTRPGEARGPAQNNLDFALAKAFAFSAFRENGTAQFRAELFNAFNTPQFADPGTSVDSPTFGVINALAVNPRVMQLAVRFSF